MLSMPASRISRLATQKPLLESGMGLVRSLTFPLSHVIGNQNRYSGLSSQR